MFLLQPITIVQALSLISQCLSRIIKASSTGRIQEVLLNSKNSSLFSSSSTFQATLGTRFINNCYIQHTMNSMVRVQTQRWTKIALTCRCTMEGLIQETPEAMGLSFSSSISLARHSLVPLSWLTTLHSRSKNRIQGLRTATLTTSRWPRRQTVVIGLLTLQSLRYLHIWRLPVVRGNKTPRGPINSTSHQLRLRTTQRSDAPWGLRKIKTHNNNSRHLIEDPLKILQTKAMQHQSVAVLKTRRVTPRQLVEALVGSRIRSGSFSHVKSKILTLNFPLRGLSLGAAREAEALRWQKGPTLGAIAHWGGHLRSPMNQ